MEKITLDTFRRFVFLRVVAMYNCFSFSAGVHVNKKIFKNTQDKLINL